MQAAAGQLLAFAMTDYQVQSLLTQLHIRVSCFCPTYWHGHAA